jgi:hypothetical protein
VSTTHPLFPGISALPNGKTHYVLHLFLAIKIKQIMACILLKTSPEMTIIKYGVIYKIEVISLQYPVVSMVPYPNVPSCEEVLRTEAAAETEYVYFFKKSADVE